MKPKGKATPSSLRNWRGARKERVPTISKSGRLFPKNGVLPRRRGCRLFPKLTDYFFLPRIRFGASISDDRQFHPVWDYIILYVKRGGVAVGPLGPPIVSGPRCQTGCCLHRRRFARKRQTDPVGSCREGFCEMPSTPSTPSGTGSPLGFCSVEESTGGRGGSPGLVS